MSGLPKPRIQYLTLRLLALAGISLSVWLLYLKASGSITYLVGCGAESGCANVLGSRWSQWFSVPVAGLSLGLYGVLLVLCFKPRREGFLFVGVCLGGGALWFVGLQALVIREFCPWCLTSHVVGVAAAVLAVREGTSGWRWRPFAGGVAALVLLVLGQIFGPVPESHEESSASLESGGAINAGPVHSRGEGRQVSLAGKSYHVESLPHVGAADAPHVLVKYFDYACDSCRDLHEDLEAVMALHPGKFCIILLPCPIERACNPHVPEHIGDHAHACGLARVALACWRQQPEAFAEVHHALFARPLRDPKAAMGAVRKFLAKDLPPGALEDPWIDEMLAADAEDYKRAIVTDNGLTNYLMPKLLVGGTRMLHGVTKDRQTLVAALEKEFGLGGK